MPSFDVVSEVDHHELSNGVDQANREVTNRFDFKGTGSKFELEGNVVSMKSQSDFQLGQMRDILHQKLSKRGIDIGCLKILLRNKVTKFRISLSLVDRFISSRVC